MSPRRIAVTPGDPEGIGPEVGILALQALRDRSDVTFVPLGDEALWRRAAGLRGVPADLLRAEPVADPADLKLLHVDASEEWLQIPEVAAIATAVQGCLDGRFDAVCTGPIHKASLMERGFPYAGHTGFLAALCGLAPSDAVMVFAGGRLVVSLATTHIPLAEVPSRLTPAHIVRAARGGERVVRQRRPGAPVRVAVCGLNPHAGEDGLLGSEDRDVVAPAVAQLRANGMDASGPWPADTLFGRAVEGEFDLVVALYHDQGLIPVKTIDLGRSVNITAGLPIVRTSVDHGTARDIAWTARANGTSMIAALEMAAELACD